MKTNEWKEKCWNDTFFVQKQLSEKMRLSVVIISFCYEIDVQSLQN